jgi:hypothetical protein
MTSVRAHFADKQKPFAVYAWAHLKHSIAKLVDG